MIEALIFDMDGTVISLGDNYDFVHSFHKLYKDSLFEFTGRDYSSLTGSQIYETIKSPYEESRKILMEWGISSPYEFWQRVAEKDLKAREDYRNEFFVYPDVFDMLEEISSYRDSLKMGILTNTPIEIAEMQLNLTGLNSKFYPVLGFEYNEPNSKPSGWGILKILEKWEIPPENTIMIGDAEQDVEAGKNAGVWTGQVFRKGHPELRGTKADFEGKDLLELWEKANEM